MMRKEYYGHQARKAFEKRCRQCDICTVNRVPRTKASSVLHQYNVGLSFSSITIDEIGPFPLNDQGKQYFVIAMDHFTKWKEAFAIPNQEASKVAASECHESCTATKAVTSGLVLCRECCNTLEWARRASPHCNCNRTAW
jgi:hypothetical protein